MLRQECFQVQLFSLQHIFGIYILLSLPYRLYKKSLSLWGQTSQQSLDSGCFEVASSHQQGIRMTSLAHHLYTHGEPFALVL